MDLHLLDAVLWTAEERGIEVDILEAQRFTQELAMTVLDDMDAWLGAVAAASPPPTTGDPDTGGQQA